MFNFFLILEILLVNFLCFFCISDFEMFCDFFNLDIDFVLRGLIKY